MALRATPLVALLFTLLVNCVRVAGQPIAERLRVEYLATPLCIDEALPRFSFARSHTTRGASQTSHRITLTNASSGLLVFDSGRVASTSSLNIEYAGPALTSDTDFSWTAQWADAAGTLSQRQCRFATV